MNDTVMFAQYNQAANKTVYDLLNKMSNEEREMDRGSYYGSLSSLFRHIMGGTAYFLGLCKSALGANAGAIKALSALKDMPKLPEGPLTEVQWKNLETAANTLDAAYVAMAQAITEADRSLPVKIDWFGGNPAAAPLAFMLNQLVVHNTHHRGQISQILDSLKIENDYSGTSMTFM